MAREKGCWTHSEPLGTHTGRAVRAAAPLADGVKFIFKEDLTPPHVYKPLYIAAPMIAVMCALTSISVIPIGNAITSLATKFRSRLRTSTSGC